MEFVQYTPALDYVLAPRAGKTVIEVPSAPSQAQEVQSKVDTLLSSGAVELFIGIGIGYVLCHTKKTFSKDEKSIRATREDIQEILFANTLHEKNPIVIYKKNKPIFWNLAMEKITGYTFAEIQEMDKRGVNIMELFYGHSEHELTRVKDSVGTALETGEGYEERVFTMKNRDGQLVRIAWHNEVLPGDINIRKGNIDLARKLQMMVESGATIEDLMIELMRKTDEYTSGHINRVMYISVEIAGLYGYDEKKLGQLKIMAGLHDIGKTKVDNSVLRKPGTLTPEERKSMECHAGNGVYQGIRNGYGELIRGMPHHSHFYSKGGNPKLKFHDLVDEIKLKIHEIKQAKAQGKTDLSLDELVEGIQQEKDTAPILFNHLVGENIPEEARIISIADTIDAIVSRRIYSKFLIYPIEQLIAFLEQELLDSAGLISNNGVIMFDDEKWRAALDHEAGYPYCIPWGEGYYVPRSEDVKIQFDPTILVSMYQNGSLVEDIKETIRKNDAILIPKKIIEIEQYLFDFEQKLTDNKEGWTEADEKTFTHLKEAKSILGGFIL